jgi:Fur family ferric uptake transcriptional regulator
MRNRNKVFKGRRFTKAREEMVRLLPNMKGHFTTQDLFFALKKRNTPIGIATVYRTLNLLSRRGILKRTLTRMGFVYELSKGEIDMHLLCKDCGRIFEIDNKECAGIKNALTEFLEKLQRNVDFKMENCDIVIQGLCKRCKKIEK